MQFLVPESLVGRGIARFRQARIERRGMPPATRLSGVEEGGVGYAAQPQRGTAALVVVTERDVGLDQGVLGNVVGLVLPAQAQSQQEAAQCLLLALYHPDKLLTCHI